MAQKLANWGIGGGTDLSGAGASGLAYNTPTPPSAIPTGTPGTAPAPADLPVLLNTADGRAVSGTVWGGDFAAPSTTPPTDTRLIWPVEVSGVVTAFRWYNPLTSAWENIFAQAQVSAASALTSTLAVGAVGSTGNAASVANGALFLQGMPIVVFDSLGYQAFGIVTGVSGNTVTFTRYANDTGNAAASYGFTAANLSYLSIAGMPGAAATALRLAQFPASTSGVNGSYTLPQTPDGNIELLFSDLGLDTSGSFSVAGNVLTTSFATPAEVSNIVFVFSY